MLFLLNAALLTYPVIWYEMHVLFYCWALACFWEQKTHCSQILTHIPDWFLWKQNLWVLNFVFETEFYHVAQVKP